MLVTLLGNFSAVISGVLAFAFNGVESGGLSGWKWLVVFVYEKLDLANILTSGSF